MSTQGYTTSFVVNQTPEEAFSAINNVRGWWSGEIEGPTSKLGDEFTYRYKDVYYAETEDSGGRSWQANRVADSGGVAEFH